MKKESFSKQVKEELCSNTYTSQDRLRALLAAYIRINGTLSFRDKKSYLTLSTENAKIARFIYETINRIYEANAHFSFSKGTNLAKTITYTIEVQEASETILEDLDISFLEGKISKNIVKNDDTISGYLAGAFLASGSVNSPHTSNYHLEIAVNSENYAKWLSKLFAKYHNSDIEPKVIKRRESYVIYFKKSDQISIFLIMIGAVISCMEFENVRVNRDMINSANRLTNMDTANMKKTYETGLRQVKEIKLIDERLGIDNISNTKMRTLCHLRLDNESLSLNDLADLMSEELNTNITKSNINHLFRSIHELYLRLDNERQ
ncbi:MAG: DNA-binding protein WhiA [Bacilli bacterium]|nr:DNA-binding protein WhiA [Bacilli bacterium]